MAVNAQSKAPSNIDTPNTAWAVLFYDDNERRWGFKKDDGTVKYFTEVGDETLTSINLNANTLTYTDEAGNNTEIDLSIYLDDTNLARLVNGTLDGNTGIATFSRDDGTSFTVDFSSLIDIETITTFTEAPAGVFTYTSEDASTTVINISSFESSTQLDARDSANRDRANHTGTQPASTISDFDTEVSNNVDVSANTAKVTNANHTGEVIGSGALTVSPTVISNKATVTPVATDMLLLWDATDSALKKIDAANFLGGGVLDHGALTGLTPDDDHPQYLLVNGTRSMTGDLDMGTSEIKLDETKKIIFDSNATSTQYIYADTYFGVDIFSFRSAAVFNFDITSNIFQGRYDFQLGTNNNGQYFRIKNDSNAALFQFYGDGTSKGLPFTFNGGHDGNITGTTLVSWGANNADGPLVLPANCTLDRVTIGLSKAGTQGTFDLEYELNGPATFGTVVTLLTFDATSTTGPDYNRDWKIVKNIGTTFNEGDRLRFRTNNNGSFAPTSGQQPVITLYFTTNE